jgi:uncharacterized protein (TIGR00661 family)
MKILYALQGTGNGHISRAKEIVPILQNYGDVDVMISGKECSIDFEFMIDFRYEGLNYVFGKKGGIDFWKTIKNFKLFRFFKEVKNFPIKNYDLVINDFEPVSAWAAKFSGTNIISLSHQNAVFDQASPKYGRFKIERLILKYYAPAKNRFGFHFSTYSSSIFLPVIRHKIRSIRRSEKGHYTVYLPSYDYKKIHKILTKIPLVKWHIFSKDTERIIFKKNVIIYPVNEFDFVKSLASCNGVLCGAGFETPAEALYLRKKLMVIPMKNQYEQQCNAIALKELGVTVIKKLNKKNLDKIAYWISSTEKVEVNYPDQTKDIIESLLLPYHLNMVMATT